MVRDPELAVTAYTVVIAPEVIEGEQADKMREEDTPLFGEPCDERRFSSTLGRVVVFRIG